jgi:hypothetical protein
MRFDVNKRSASGQWQSAIIIQNGATGFPAQFFQRALSRHHIHCLIQLYITRRKYTRNTCTRYSVRDKLLIFALDSYGRHIL